MNLSSPRFLSIALLSFLAVCVVDGVNAAVTVFPANPRPLETVRIQVEAGGINGMSSDVFDLAATQVLMSGNRITVVLKNMGRGLGLPEPSPALDLPIGQYPTGDYVVDLRMESAGASTVIGTSSFAVRPKTSQDRVSNLTDIWWSPQESGWGLNIAQHSSGIIFATWTLYDQDRKATWYVASGGEWLNSGVTYVGPLYRVNGPTFCFDGDPCNRPGFDPALVSHTPVGSVTLQIIPGNYDQLLASITLEGKTITRFMRRLIF